MSNSAPIAILVEVTNLLNKLKVEIGNDVVPSLALNHNWLVISLEWPNGVTYDIEIPQPDKLPDLVEEVIEQAKKHYKQELRRI